MKYIKTLKIDIDKKNFEVIPSVQYDSNTRFLHIQLLNDSVPFDITGCSVILSGVKEDGNPIFNSCDIINSEIGFIQAEVTEQMNAIPGNIDCEIKIYDGKGVLTSKKFTIKVTASQTSRSVVSSNEFKALTDALNKVQAIDNKAEKAEVEKLSSQLDTKVSESDLEVERKRIDNFTRLAEGSTTGDAELIDARVGADSILYNNVGDAIRNQLDEKLEKYIKTLVNYTEILSNGIGSDKSLVSGLKRQKYSIDIGTEYLLVGNIVTDKSVDIMAQSTSGSNSGIIDETRVAKTSDGLQKIKFTAQYPYLFVTCSNENDFKLYKIDKRITTKEEVIEAVSNSKTINDLKNRNNLTVELLNNDINFTTEKEIESTATNTSTISKNGTYISEGSLKIFPTTPGKYYVIQGTSKYEKDDYGLFAFFKTNSFSDILMDTLVVVSKGEHSLNYIVQAPLNGNLLRISRGTFEIDDVKVYEYEKNEKTTNVQEMQKYKCFDDSAIKCSPYMWESIGWKTYNPRLNILMFNDFNDEHELLRETCEWFKYDEIFANRTISCVISQGDIVSLDHSSSTTWTTRAKNIVDIVNDIDKPFIFCNGNHDVGQDNTTSNFDVSTNRDIRYDNFFKPLLDRLNVTSGNRVVVDVNNPRSQYYYVDLEDNFGHKIRCFALDESEYPLIIDTDGQLKYSMCLIRTTDRERGNNTYYSEKQMNFLVSALQSCENDRLFILLNHIDMPTTDLRGSLSGSRECLHSIINGFINNTDVVATVNALENIPSYTINATFSNKSGEHPIIHFVGHYHKFEHTIIADAGNMNRVQTICGGTEGTGVMGKNSILRFGADIFSMDKDFSAYFLRFGYKYKAMAKDDGNHFIEQPLKLI